MQTIEERFLRYVKINTTSDENSESCPSTACQLDLARLLRDELDALGVQRARMDENGYVYGEIPANCEGKPGIGLPAGNARRIAEEIRERVREDLGVYLNERMISGESIVDGS